MPSPVGGRSIRQAGWLKGYTGGRRLARHPGGMKNPNSPHRGAPLEVPPRRWRPRPALLFVIAWAVAWFGAGVANAQAPSPIQVHPSQGQQTWSHVAQNDHAVHVVYHSGQDVWLSTWDRELQQEIRFQRANTLLAKQQDECKISICPQTQCVFVSWSDRYTNYTESMACVGRWFDPLGVPLDDEFSWDPSVTTSLWRPTLAADPEGGVLGTATGDWNENSYSYRFHPDGTIEKLGLMHPETGASENYPDIRPGPGDSYVGVYRLDNSRIMLRGAGMVGGIEVGQGWQPRLGRSELVWQDLTGKEVWHLPIDARGIPVGSAEFLAPGRDPESEGRWTVWEDRVESVIKGHKDGGPILTLSGILGPSSPYESDRRTPNTNTWRGRTLLAYSGWHTTGRRAAFVAVLEGWTPESVEVAP